MAKHKKISFIISVVMLAIFLPLTIIGIIYHKIYNTEKNPNHEFHYNNKLYFYDSMNNLIGTYDCNYENCGYAEELIEDDEYKINYFKMFGIEKKAIVNDRYAIIADYKDTEDEIIIYDIVNNNKLKTYTGYKIYGVGIANNYVVLINEDNMYGVMKFDERPEQILPFEYEFIGLQNEIDQEQRKIASNNFIVKKDGTWGISDENGSILTSSLLSPIVALNDSSFIMNTDDNYSIYNYDGSIKLNGVFKSLNYLSNYLEIRDLNNKYYILNIDSLESVSQTYEITDESLITSRINGDKLEVVIDGEIKETIDI